MLFQEIPSFIIMDLCFQHGTKKTTIVLHINAQRNTMVLGGITDATSQI